MNALEQEDSGLYESAFYFYLFEVYNTLFLEYLILFSYDCASSLVRGPILVGILEMPQLNLEYSNIVLMIYKQIVLFAGIGMLFMIGLDSTRRYILPPEWAKASKVSSTVKESTTP